MPRRLSGRRIHPIGHPIRPHSRRRRPPRCLHHFVGYPAKEEGIGLRKALGKVTMQVFVRRDGPMIAAPVQCDVDGIPKGSHDVLLKWPNETQDQRPRALASVPRSQGVDDNHPKRPSQTCSRSAASPYRLTRVVHKLRSGAPRRRPHRPRQIVNKSAATKSLSVDKSACLISLLPGNTHRSATNMHRKQFQDYFNQSFERVPVRSRSTNEFSFADASFNASTIRLSQNGSNACWPRKNADQQQKESKLP